jgi:hypothetical protein
VRLDDSNRAHTVEDEPPPLAVQSAEVGPNRCAGVPATARSGVRKKTDGACPSSRKMAILSNRKATAEPNGKFSPEAIRRLCYLRAFVRWLLPPWSAFVLFGRERGGGGDHVSMAKMPGSSEQGRKLRGLCIPGLSRVGTTPIHSVACRRHIFLKFSKAGVDEVPEPCTECCRKKSRVILWRPLP